MTAHMQAPEIAGSAEQTDIINSHYPEVDPADISWLDNGATNIVGLVETSEGGRCFRFPRTVAARDDLAYEFSVLNAIKGSGSLSVETPEPIMLARDNAYGIVTRLDGSSWDESAVHTLPEERRRAFGATMGVMLTQLNDIFAPEQSGEVVAVSPIDTWHDWYEGLREQGNHGVLSEIFTHFYQLYAQSLGSRKSKEVFIHGDLHPNNLLFNDSGEVSGVIDFGRAGMGCVHQELRLICRIGGYAALDAAVEQLDDRFQPVNVDSIKYQTVLHEIAVFIKHMLAGQLSERRAVLANQSLERWLGDAWLRPQTA